MQPHAWCLATATAQVAALEREGLHVVDVNGDKAPELAIKILADVLDVTDPPPPPPPPRG